MIEERGWNPDGTTAAHSDEIALIEREPVTVSYHDRESRGWWRMVAQGNQRGADTERRGYIPPSTTVPGETPGDAGKGKKGAKGHGKRSRDTYEGDRWQQSGSSSTWSWWDNPGDWSRYRSGSWWSWS